MICTWSELTAKSVAADAASNNSEHLKRKPRQHVPVIQPSTVHRCTGNLSCYTLIIVLTSPCTSPAMKYSFFADIYPEQVRCMCKHEPPLQKTAGTLIYENIFDGNAQDTFQIPIKGSPCYFCLLLHYFPRKDIACEKIKHLFVWSSVCMDQLLMCLQRLRFCAVAPRVSRNTPDPDWGVCVYCSASENVLTAVHLHHRVTFIFSQKPCWHERWVKFVRVMVHLGGMYTHTWICLLSLSSAAVVCWNQKKSNKTHWYGAENKQWFLAVGRWWSWVGVMLKTKQQWASEQVLWHHCL